MLILTTCIQSRDGAARNAYDCRAAAEVAEVVAEFSAKTRQTMVLVRSGSRPVGSRHVSLHDLVSFLNVWYSDLNGA